MGTPSYLLFPYKVGLANAYMLGWRNPVLLNDVKEYKSRYVDRYGAANMMLLNAQGETLDLGSAYTVKHLDNGRLKMRWKVKTAVHQWYPYTHASFYDNNGKTVFLYEVGRLNLYENPQSSVEINFEYD